MSAPSFQFLLFAAVLAGVFNLAPRIARPLCVLAANILFLISFSHQPAAFLPFAGFLVFGYVGTALLQRGYRRLFWGFLFGVLLIFFWLKKYTFIPPQTFIDYPYLTIGLSYVFFRVLHLIIDANSGDLPDRIDPLTYINYTLDFTCIIAGPIQLYQDYKTSTVALTAFSAGAAMERVVIGFFKVFIVSALIDSFHKQAIHDLAATPDSAHAVLYGMEVVGLYPLYLYANFSGYTDTVLGVARFLHRKLPENFDKPFISRNFIEFWSRWHISLSSWLKTYVYNPLILTLMRNITSRAAEPFLAVLAFFVTFFLVGAWHGQTSEFLFFGVLQGGGVSINKLYQILMARWLGKREYRALAANPVYTALARGLTFVWFGFTLLWFWSSWPEIGRFASELGLAGVVGALVAMLALAVPALALFDLMVGRDAPFGKRAASVLQSRYLRTATATAMVAVILAINVVLDSPAPDIVYKAF